MDYTEVAFSIRMFVDLHQHHRSKRFELFTVATSQVDAY